MSELETADGDDWTAALAEQRSASEGGGDDWGAALAEQRTADPARGGSSVAPAAFETLHSSGVAGRSADLDSILDIPITLSVEIGKSKLSIRNLLQLNQGSVVELDRMAGEPLDVLINGMLVAHGEVVVVNEKLGIRLTDVVSAQERVKKLK
jgi:flagellar motor switch protein FliN/FliY